jgi:hypothetical protein
MKSIITIAVAFTILASIASQASQPGALPGVTSEPVRGAPETNSPPAAAAGYNQAISQYVAFLKAQKQSPADYILGLFQTNDLVILCERHHGEITQYDMIFEVLSNPRFQQDVRHIFTEVGAAALWPYIDAFLMDDGLSEEQVNAKLRYIAANLSWQGAWERTNYYDFLKRVRALNCALPKERRVHIYPADLDFDWTKATKRRVTKFADKYGGSRRDQLMADHVLSRFKQLRQADGQAKALVIMNYRHAFPELKVFASKEQNAGAFLMRAYPGRVANVLINTVAPEPHWAQQPINHDAVGGMIPVQDGKWDAAFAVLGNPNLGFDFHGSPLGEDAFDLFPFRRMDARYREVFTGFVFYKPLREHRISVGFPKGVLDEALADELLRRSQFWKSGWDSRKDVETYYAIRVFPYESESNYEKMIQRWLDTSAALR